MLRTGARGTGNTFNVYWGGALIGTIDPDSKAMQDFSFDLIGGARDGSNTLLIEGVGPSDGYGTSLDTIRVD